MANTVLYDSRLDRACAAQRQPSEMTEQLSMYNIELILLAPLAGGCEVITIARTCLARDISV